MFRWSSPCIQTIACATHFSVTKWSYLYLTITSVASFRSSHRHGKQFMHLHTKDVPTHRWYTINSEESLVAHSFVPHVDPDSVHKTHIVHNYFRDVALSSAENVVSSLGTWQHWKPKWLMQALRCPCPVHCAINSICCLCQVADLKKNGGAKADVESAVPITSDACVPCDHASPWCIGAPEFAACSMLLW